MKRLTDEQRDLAGLPEHIALAGAMASAYFARCRASEVDELRQAALVGLCDAASKYDPTRGVPFRLYAKRRIAGAILDHLRTASGRGMGGGRMMLKRGDAPAVRSLADVASAVPHDGERVALSEAIPAGELPVGWEIESEDAVTVLSGRLPKEYGPLIRAFYLGAATPRLREAGASIGASEARARQVAALSHGFLRENLEHHNEIEARRELARS